MRPRSLILIFTFFLFSTPFRGFSQNLTFEKLIKFQTLSKKKINRKLEKKNWRLISDMEATSDMLGKTVWAYNPNLENETATAWCILYHSASTPNRILFNPSDEKSLAVIKEKIKKRKGIKQINTIPPTFPAYINSIDAFTDGDYIFLVQTYVQPGYGGIKIFLKEDYQKAFHNGKL